MPTIAVITPYCREPLEIIRRCHDSVLAQGLDVHHVLVSDGHPHEAVDHWPVTHVRLPHLGDYGNTPRMIGAAIAAAQHYEAICFLDADNWYEPQHLRTLQALATSSQAPVITCARLLRRPDGSVLGVCDESDGERFNDTNCYLLGRPAFALLGYWCFQAQDENTRAGDRHFWKSLLQSGLARRHSPLPTVNYVTRYFAHYLARGESPPPGARSHVFIDGGWRTVDLATFIALQSAKAARSS